MTTNFPEPPSLPPAADPHGNGTPAGPVSLRMTLEPHGWTVDVPPGTALLAAARAAGITMPSSCRNGTCRACMCRLVHGRVGYLIDWPGLSAQEKQDGFVLPCVAVAESPLTLDVPGAHPAPAGRPR
jgi:ferredoxin